MLRLLLLLSIPALMWAAPAYRYSATIGPSYGFAGSTSEQAPLLAAWEFRVDVDGELPQSGVVNTLGAFSMTGVPAADAILEFVVIISSEADNEGAVRAWFSSPSLGRFRYNSQRDGAFDHVGQYRLGNSVFWENGNESYFDGTLALTLLHTPEPYTWAMLAIGLALIFVGAIRQEHYNRTGKREE